MAKVSQYLNNSSFCYYSCDSRNCRYLYVGYYVIDIIRHLYACSYSLVRHPTPLAFFHTVILQNGLIACKNQLNFAAITSATGVFPLLQQNIVISKICHFFLREKTSQNKTRTLLNYTQHFFTRKQRQHRCGHGKDTPVVFLQRPPSER